MWPLLIAGGVLLVCAGIEEAAKESRGNKLSSNSSLDDDYKELERLEAKRLEIENRIISKYQITSGNQRRR